MFPQHAARRAWFLENGWTPADLRRAVREHELIQPTRGWLAAADADPVVVAALRRDGVISCVSALQWHGIEVLRPRRMHLRPIRRRPSPGTWCRTWRSYPVLQPVDPIGVALEAAVRCCAGEELLVILDSVVRQHVVTVGEVEGILLRAPERKQRLLDHVGQSESVGESLVCHRLRSLRVKFRTQVWIEGVGRVDFLIGDRLVLEVDGRRYHSDDVAFGNDRRRDRVLTRLGYRILRITYADILNAWPAFEAEILQMLRADQHRSRASA